MAHDFLHEQHRAETSRTHVFMLATSVSAIGFAMFQTADREWHWSLLITFLAVAIWSLSFFSGIKYSHNVQYFIMENINQNELSSRGASVTKLDSVSKKLAKYVRCAKIWHNIQLYSLLGGAIMYFAGHITKIIYDVKPAMDACA